MTSDEMRRVGLAAGSIAFLAAATIAVVAEDPRRQAVAAPSAVVAAAAAFDGPTPTTQAPTTADSPNLKFLVRFSPNHPLGRAMALAAKGDRDGAEALARRTLTRRADLAGLCFDDFTLGGAEVVLVLCEPEPDRRVESAARQWLKYLRAQSGVVYVDRNVIVKPVAKSP